MGQRYQSCGDALKGLTQCQEDIKYERSCTAKNNEIPIYDLNYQPVLDPTQE